jgi:Family of unknown function (DUF6286)
MRIANRLLAFIVAAAIVVVGIIIIIEVIAARSGAAPVIIGWHSILSWGRRNPWNADSVEVASSITAVAGLLLLLPQLRRRRPTRLTVTSADATDAALTRKGVSAAVRGAVNDVEGITISRVKVKHRKVAVNATSHAATDGTAADLKSQVKQSAQEAIDQLQFTSKRRLKVHVDSRKKGAA